MAICKFIFIIATALLHSVFSTTDADEIHQHKPRWQNKDHWVDTWVTMPQLTEPANLPNPPFVSQAQTIPIAWYGF
jgi:hypothetical protein